MNEYRKKITAIDEQIMALLEERFLITKKLGTYKQSLNLPIENKEREEEILAKTKEYLFAEEITKIYKELFTLSKEKQSYKYALIGKKLPYTLSPQVYKALGLDGYFVLETDDFLHTIRKHSCLGYNVTIPYKEVAYRYCSEYDSSSSKTGVVNTIIGKKGYNTDYLAFEKMFSTLDINLKKAKVLIIGHGATARSANVAVGGQAIFLVRHKKQDNESQLSDYHQHLDAEVIINATPYGTYPELEDAPLFPLTEFSKLQVIVEVVYNPLNTPLILEAKKRGVKFIDGFKLLVTQACLAYQLFTKNEVDSEALYHKLRQINLNIVLIGMPYSGKSHLAKKLGEILNKEVLDFDEILKKENKDLSSVLKTEDINVFREHERQLAKSLMNVRAKIIAPGGGIVLSKQAMQYLKLNSVVVFLNTPLSVLKSRLDNSRPLIKEAKDIDLIYAQRSELYKEYADITVDEESAVEKIYDYLYN